MTIHIKSTAQLPKTFRVAREKLADDSEQVIAHLKVSDIMLDRDALDELCGRPLGWSSGALFDEFGAPVARLTLALHRDKLAISGMIDGGKKQSDPKLILKDAAIDGVTLELTKLGALFGCSLSWTAAGDEVDDIADMLGRLCNVDIVIHDGGQQDILSPLQRLLQTHGVESVEITDGDGKVVLSASRKKKSALKGAAA